MNIAESYLSALGSGIQQGQQMQQARNESALAPLRQQALEQQIQSSQLGMDSTRQSMAFDAETHQIQVKEHLAKMTADERATAAENVRQNIGLVISADTPEKWDNIASQAAPELVGQFGQREAIVNSLRTTEQQIAAYDAANAPVKPDWVTVDGHMVDRNAPGGPAVVPVAGMEPQGPEWQPAPPEMLAQYGAQAGQFNVKTGQFRDFNQPSSTSLTTNPDGTMTYAQGPGVTGMPKTTEGEKSAAGYLSRMRAAETILDDLSTKGVETRNMMSMIVSGTNFEGMALDASQQQLLQATRDWVRAKLRKESGAVISPQEMAEEIRTYFPLPGEYAETIAQKARARREAEKQFTIMAGPASALAGSQSPDYKPAPSAIPEDFTNGLGALPDGVTPQSIWDAMPEEDRGLWAK